MGNTTTETLKDKFRIENCWDEKTGLKLSETWFSSAGRDRLDGGAAHRLWNIENGVVFREEFWRHGQRSYYLGPAVILRDPTSGEVLHETWARDGLIHRVASDEPSVWFKNPESGIIYSEKFYKHGRLHRDQGPAVILRDPLNGTLVSEKFYRFGQCLQTAEITLQHP